MEYTKSLNYGETQDVLEWFGDNTSALMLDESIKLGGQGSGNFGHSGRPGEVGGSGEAGVSDVRAREIEHKIRNKMITVEHLRGMTNRRWGAISRDKQVVSELYEYTEHSASLNSALRSGYASFLPEVEHIDKGFEVSKRLGDDVTVFRGASASALGIPKDELNEESLKTFVGKTIIDKAYTSTSIDEGVAQFFSENVMLKVLLPKGSKCIPINGKSAFKREHEVLLPRNSQFEIVSTAYVDGVASINCVYTGSGESIAEDAKPE